MSAPQPSELELIQQMSAGDQSALRSLYDRYAAAVFSLACQLTGNQRDAEEIVQDVFTAVWKNSSGFDSSRSALFTWMTSIARHKAIDRLRHNDRRLPALRFLPDGGEPDASDPGGNPRDRLLDREQARTVRDCLSELPADQAQALLMAFFENMTHREIAERTGTPLGTVKSRIRVALLALRDRLKGRAAI